MYIIESKEYMYSVFVFSTVRRELRKSGAVALEDISPFYLFTILVDWHIQYDINNQDSLIVMLGIRRVTLNWRASKYSLLLSFAAVHM